MNVDVIRKVTTQYSAVGADQFSAKTRDAGRAHNEMATAVRSSTNVVSEQEVAMARLQRQMDITAQTSKQFAAANDNISGSLRSAGDATQGFFRGLADGASGILETASHLKLLAVAAYAVSPAVRSFVNAGVGTAMSAMGANAGLLSSAVSRVASVAGPALAFFSRIALPITIAVAAFKLFNDTLSLGSGLLEKYGKSQRDLYGQNVLKGYGAGIDGKDVTSGFVGSKAIDDATAQLTRFQNETLTAQQVQYATQLGVRLNQAKQSLDDTLKVQINLTDAALRLQNVWVVIVETIAKALALASQIPDKFAQGANAIGRSSVWNYLPQVSGDQSAAITGRINANAGFGPGGTAQISAEQSLDLAKKKLAAGMGGGFTGRWSQDMYDLANPPEKAKDKDKETDAWTRFADQVTKANAAMQASVQTVGLASGAHEKLKIELQGAAILEREGVVDDEARRAKLAELAQQAGDTAAALERTRINNQIGFDRNTMFLSPEDVQIAQQLKGLYGNDIPAALNSTEAAGMRVNNTLKDIKSSASDFGQALNQALASGKTGAEALTAALNTIATKLASKAMDAGINSMLGGATSMFGSMFGGGGNMGEGGANLPSTWSDTGAIASSSASAASGVAGMSSVGGPLLMAAGIGISLIQGAMAKKTQQRAQDAADRLASQQRADQYIMTAQLAGIDTSTEAGALQAFDIQAANSRLNELKQRYPQMAALEQQLAAQRLAIVKQFNDQIIAESKKILDYVQGLQTGSLSTLSPQDQLAALQSTFSSHLASAQGGDQTALSGITQDADALLQAAKSFFASTAGYADIFNTVTNQLTSLGNHPALYDSAGNLQPATGFVNGGLISNGIFGVDSVRARFAGGGDIMLAGGEFVNRAQSVNTSTFPTLDHINRTGRVPSNDNSAGFAMLAGVIQKAAEDSSRINAQGYNNQTQILRDELTALRGEVAELRKTTKAQAERPARPGAPQQQRVA